MPFKSKAQRRKFAELLMKGKITDEAYERWNKETGGAELPEYADPKKAKSKARAKRSSTAKKTTGATKSKQNAGRKRSR